MSVKKSLIMQAKQMCIDQESICIYVSFKPVEEDLKIEMSWILIVCELQWPHYPSITLTFQLNI